MTYNTTNSETNRNPSQYVSLHQLLATDASFIEQASHSAVQQCVEEYGTVRQEKKMEQREILGKKEVPVSNNVQTSKVAKNSTVQTKGYSRSDVIVSAPKGGKAQTSYSIQENIEIAPPDAPKKDDIWTDGDLSVISVLNRVLVVCAQTGSEFWKNMWQQATQNMMQALSLAKPIADAVVNQANAQADATQAESDMNKSDGILKCTFAAISFGIGLKESFFPKEDTNMPQGIGSDRADAAESAAAKRAAGAGPAGEAGEATDALETEQSGAATQTQKTSATASSQANTGTRVDEDVARRAEQANNTDNFDRDPAARDNSQWAKNKPAPSRPGNDPVAQSQARADRAARTVGGEAAEKPNKVLKGAEGVFNRSKSFTEKAWQGFLKGFQVATGMGLMADGICGVAYDAPGKAKMATAQRAAGQFEAQSKMGEMIAQFHNNAFSRAEDMRQGAQQQQIDNPMNVLKTAADTVTQAVLAQHV